MYVFIFLVKVTEWPPIGKIAAHSAYEMFSWYKYLMVSLVFSHLGFWSGIAPFPELCLLVPSYSRNPRPYMPVINIQPILLSRTNADEINQ